MLCATHPVFAVGGVHKFALASGFDASLIHRASNPFHAPADTIRHQLFAHVRPAILLLDLGMDGPDMVSQGFAADAIVGARPEWSVSSFAPHVLEEAACADVRTLLYNLHEVRRSFPQHVTLHPYPDVHSAQSAQLHLLWAHRLVTSAFELCLLGQAKPVL